MKRLVICADGTWNERDRLDPRTGTRRPTNVTKTARAVRAHDDQGICQVTYYHPGVGTGGPLDQLTGGAFGEGMDANIQEMYRFIAYNHEPGDELFLFGFSRGAYTVRSLAGFLHFAGLVSKDEDYYVPDLYRCYMARQGQDRSAWDRLFVEPIAKGPKAGRPRLVDRRAQCPTIRFMGVWDTVGALGPPGLAGRIVKALGKDAHAYHDVGLNPRILNVAHALAIDERRGPFRPTLYEQGDWPGTLHQAWFAGVHTDVGGGYDYDDYANYALRWVLDHAATHGLALDQDYLKAFWHDRLPERPIHDSMSAMYRVTPAYERPIGQAAGGHETVHESALALVRQDRSSYQPPNLLRWIKSSGRG